MSLDFEEMREKAKTQNFTISSLTNEKVCLFLVYNNAYATLLHVHFICLRFVIRHTNTCTVPLSMRTRSLPKYFTYEKTPIGSITATHIYIPTRDGRPCKNIVHDEQKKNNSKEKVTLLCCVIITWFSFPYQTNWNWLIGPVDHFITYLEIEQELSQQLQWYPIVSRDLHRFRSNALVSPKWWFYCWQFECDSVGNCGCFDCEERKHSFFIFRSVIALSNNIPGVAVIAWIRWIATISVVMSIIIAFVATSTILPMRSE